MKLSRSGARSQKVIAALILALADGGLAPSGLENAAVLAFGRDGSGAENELYWEDYCANGHLFGRGHLFAGTLPTTPAGEGAIALGIRGPVYYLDAGDDRSVLLSEAESLLSGGAPGVLALLADAPVVLAFLLGRGDGAAETAFSRSVLEEWRRVRL